MDGMLAIVLIGSGALLFIHADSIAKAIINFGKNPNNNRRTSVAGESTDDDRVLWLPLLFLLVGMAIVIFLIAKAA